MPHRSYLDFVKRGSVSENRAIDKIGIPDEFRSLMVAERLLLLTNFDLELAKEILDDVFNDPNFRAKLD